MNALVNVRLCPMKHTDYQPVDINASCIELLAEIEAIVIVLLH